MKRILLIDGNNIAFRCFIVMHDKTGQLRNNIGVPTTVAFGVLRAINSFTERFNVDKCIFCWDGGSKYRKKLFKYYKYNRGEAPWAKDYYEELDVTRKYYNKLGLHQVNFRGIEADDLIGYLATQIRKNGDRVIVFSDDKDFFQLSHNKVRFYRPTKMHIIGQVDTEDMLGYPPNLLPRVVAFTGEKKDNIPGVADLDNEHIMQKIGIGPAKAIKYLTSESGYYTVKQALENIPADDRFYETIVKNRKQILKSYKLARIRTKEKMYLDWERKYLDDVWSNVMMPSVAKRSTVGQIAEFLEFRSFSLLKTLTNLGVKLKR